MSIPWRWMAVTNRQRMAADGEALWGNPRRFGRQRQSGVRRAPDRRDLGVQRAAWRKPWRRRWPVRAARSARLLLDGVRDQSDPWLVLQLRKGQSLSQPPERGRQADGSVRAVYQRRGWSLAPS